ncbi:hypothetical protein GWL_16640 [Herbaspirillum sp. GW103]|nr:hypothetical protein GWL_16640 [Herbaspirillum sp. GW103]
MVAHVSLQRLFDVSLLYVAGSWWPVHGAPHCSGGEGIVKSLSSPLA